VSAIYISVTVNVLKVKQWRKREENSDLSSIICNMRRVRNKHISQQEKMRILTDEIQSEGTSSRNSTLLSDECETIHK
jgi:hypothetical protein